MSDTSYVMIGIILSLDLMAIVAVLHEEVLYGPWEKLWKIIIILVIPFFGSIIQLYYLNSIHEPRRREDDRTDTSSGYSYESSSDGSDCGGGD